MFESTYISFYAFCMLWWANIFGFCSVLHEIWIPVSLLSSFLNSSGSHEVSTKKVSFGYTGSQTWSSCNKLERSWCSKSVAPEAPRDIIASSKPLSLGFWMLPFCGNAPAHTYVHWRETAFRDSASCLLNSSTSFNLLFFFVGSRVQKV
jgi:hypothetical protein